MEPFFDKSDVNATPLPQNQTTGSLSSSIIKINFNNNFYYDNYLDKKKLVFGRE
jgi:hypothetical protein